MSRRQMSFIEQEMDRCKHFTGIQHDECSAGVLYDAVRVPREPGTGIGLPCFVSDGVGQCVKRVLPTLAEAEEDARKSAEFIGHMAAARAKIIEATGKPKPATDQRGTIPCPKCGETMHWRRASYNGHVWAKCETEDCIAWIE